MPVSSRRLALFGLLVVCALVAARPAAAQPIDPKAIPDPLRPWTSWALDGKQDALCPLLLDVQGSSRCLWPSRLELALDDRGGHFSQKWHVDAKSWVPLPGDVRRWPVDATRDGKRTALVAVSGWPSVELTPGDHVVSGALLWDSLPESLHIPSETGLLSLRVRGAPVPWPNRDAEGTLWLQKMATGEEGDALEFVVHRKVTDDVPLLLTTRIELHVAGKNREELLGKALPAGFVPMSLDSPLPARVEADWRLRVQLRPGMFVLTLAARSEGPVRSLARPAPDGPWRAGDEVWVFEAKNDYRMVTVQGVPSIDPQQTTLPDDWKRLPAYPMSVGATLILDEKRRGDADPLPDQLTLSRTLWLDFDGAGYSVSDRITGSLHRESRLTMMPPTALGRVSIGGQDQFITHLRGGAEPGVEVRQTDLLVTADSRIVGDPADLPAIGWAHDFRQVSGTLHLAPGWRLVHASGVDDVPGTWLRHWTLLELFLALVAALAAGRLFGASWGAIAFVMLVLTLPEEDAPRWTWLVALAAEALFRALPTGAAKRLVDGARLGALVLVALVAVPFLVEHVRQGFYPALSGQGTEIEPPSEPAGAGGEVEQLKDDKASGAPKSAPAEDKSLEQQVEETRKGVATQKRREAPASPAASNLADALASSGYRQSNAQVYDPAAVVQTGPGLPHWRWTTLELRWSGPVASSQRLHLYLLSPGINLVLALVRAALLVLVLLRMLPWTQRLLPKTWAISAALVSLLLAVPARADIPDAKTLEELTSRLTRPPSCAPSCASSPRMALEVRPGSLRLRIEVDAAAPTAVPLPGAGVGWSPSDVLVDGRPAKALARDATKLWVEIGAGSHQILLEAAMPDRPAVELALPMKPHRVEVSSVGWTVSGVHEDGLADDNLQLTRETSPDALGRGSTDPGVLPPFVRVERTLAAGLDWQVDTRVDRVSPLGSAVVLEVPLLPGESVTTADVRVEGGKALVSMGPQTKQMAWHSVMDEKSPVTFAAPQSLAWTEVWRVDVGPIWHATFSGIPSVHTSGAMRVPEYHPWPGERVAVDLVRPDGIAGQTLTVDESTTAVTPGLRATDVALTMHLRSSRGAEHTLTLPPDAELESLSINGSAQPIRQQGQSVTFPVIPGAQTLSVTLRESRGLAALFLTPAIDLGAPSVNATLTVAVPGSRWLLLAGGPRIGPAVLFWSLLLVLLVVSIVLGHNRWTPLRWWHWLLLSIGLSQLDVVAGAVFAGWLLALGWRAQRPGHALGRQFFNLRQTTLVGWTAVALAILAVALYQGLLGAPEMQVSGNGSSSGLLRWFADRSPSGLPSAWVLTVPILVYRGAMLAWALWIAFALLGWLRWGWSAFATGGLWRGRPAPAQPPATLQESAPEPPSPPPREARSEE